MTAGTLLIFWLLIAGASTIVGSYKGRTGTGLLIGLIITACLRPSHAGQVERERGNACRCSARLAAETPPHDRPAQAAVLPPAVCEGSSAAASRFAALVGEA